jgi:hypothetical protein
MADPTTIPSVTDADLQALINAGALPATALSPAATKTIPNVASVRAAPMNPVQQNDMALDVATSRGNSIPAVAPTRVAAPAAPGIPSVDGAPQVSAAPDTSALTAAIPTVQRPTPQQSIAAGMAQSGDTAKQEGKKQFEEMKPATPEELGLKPFSPEYYQQERKISDFEKAHPYGGDISEKPGFLGKLEHVLGRIGNVAGDAFIPSVMGAIPGTDINRAGQRLGQERGYNAAIEDEQKQAATANLNSETAARGGEQLVGEPKQDPTNGQWFQAAKSRDAQGNEVLSWKPLSGGPAPTPDQAKQPVGADGATQFGQQLGTLTSGMSPEDQQKFTQAYGIKPTDTGATAEKRLADAKAAAQLTGAERDRKIQEDATAAQRAETNRIQEEELALKKQTADQAAGKGSTDVVRAYDENNVPHLMSEADAKAAGYKNVQKASDKDINDARTHNVVLNDMQAKLNDVVKDSGALNQNEAQRGIIAKALSDQKNTTWSSLLTSGVLSQATEPTKDYIQSVLSLRESALGLPKEITGGSRVSEVQSSALWATLPSASSLDKNYALTQAKKFQANIDRLWQRVDQVQGMSHEQPADELAPPKPAKSGEAGGGSAKPTKIPSFGEFQAQKKNQGGG